MMDKTKTMSDERKPRPRRVKRWTWDRHNEASLGPDRIEYDGKLFVLVEQGDLAQTKNVIAIVDALNRAGVTLPKRRTKENR